MAFRNGRGRVVDSEAFRWRKQPRFFIRLPGMSTYGGNILLIDGRHVLDPVLPQNCFAVCPLVDGTFASDSEVVALVHCLSYAHDAPAILTPARGTRRALVRPATGKLRGDEYYTMVEQLLDLTQELRLGSTLGFEFVFQTRTGIPGIPLLNTYHPIMKEIELYSTALRQVDPLNEFLHYYRVLESVQSRQRGGGNANGRALVDQLLGSLATHDFGTIFVQHTISARRLNNQPTRRSNLMKIYRARAARRIASLATSGVDVAARLYIDTRCGIAHGARSPLAFDYGATLEAAAADLVVVKMLARMAIDSLAARPVATPLPTPIIDARCRQERRRLREYIRRELPALERRTS